jgi:hypothetical protein
MQKQSRAKHTAGCFTPEGFERIRRLSEKKSHAELGLRSPKSNFVRHGISYY